MIFRTGKRLALALAVAAISSADGQQTETPINSLSLVALDSHDQPVNDLTADDFDIADGGKPAK